MTSIKFATIGLDHWYSAVPLTRGLSRYPQTDLPLIVDGDSGRGRALASDLGAGFSTSLDDALQDPGIDTTGTFFSVEQNPGICIRTVEAGKHIVSIKPLVRTLEEASAIAWVVGRAGVQSIPAESRSWMTDQNQRLFEIVRSGELDRIVSANLVLCGVLPKVWEDSESHGWWVEEGKAPGGGWIDHAIYQIDRLRWLLGTEPVDVIEYVANLRYPQLPAEDYGHAIFTFSDGVVATMENTWTGTGGAWRITTTLNRTKGSLAIDTINTYISVLRPDVGASPSWEWLGPLDDDSNLIQSLIDRIRGENNSLGTIHDAWRNLAAARAFHNAAVSGTRRPVPVLVSRSTRKTKPSERKSEGFQ